MLASGVAVGSGLAMAGAAVADSGTGTGSGAVATLHEPELIPGQSGPISINGDKGDTAGGLIQLDTDPGKFLETYCIDLTHETKPHAKYQEADWKATSLDTNPNKGKVLWILQNSYPHVSDLSALAKEAGAESLDSGQAAAATQAAIWHFSDGVDASPLDPKAKLLTTYLIGHAVDETEPAPSLTLTPGTVSGTAGVGLGPITVNSSGGQVDVALDAASAKTGVVLTDKSGTVLSGSDGKLLKPAKSNDQLFVKAPAAAAAGKATVNASSTTAVELGRAFISLNYTPSNHSQTLILAGSSTETVQATASASWTAVVTPTSPSPTPSATKPSSTPSASAPATPSSSPSRSAAPVPSASSTPAAGGLAFTGGGSQAPMIAGIAGALVLAGGGAVFAMRRRGRHGRTAA
ncbi:thioester domain-containing protein [Kitasatospora mediocidica]|uniref:thioester domain-containing protein n=1 Tax=Kitasatospora mediocidica TaxID=58352 RepID=UPI00068F6892|nr:thioester domain-containing protein [Kitasatospora mediocidica]